MKTIGKITVLTAAGAMMLGALLLLVASIILGILVGVFYGKAMWLAGGGPDEQLDLLERTKAQTEGVLVCNRDSNESSDPVHPRRKGGAVAVSKRRGPRGIDHGAAAVDNQAAIVACALVLGPRLDRSADALGGSLLPAARHDRLDAVVEVAELALVAEGHA